MASSLSWPSDVVEFLRGPIPTGCVQVTVTYDYYINYRPSLNIGKANDIVQQKFKRARDTGIKTITKAMSIEIAKLQSHYQLHLTGTCPELLAKHAVCLFLHQVMNNTIWFDAQFQLSVNSRQFDGIGYRDLFFSYESLLPPREPVPVSPASREFVRALDTTYYYELEQFLWLQGPG